MTAVPAAPVDPARARDRGVFVEELMRRPALVDWIGVRDPQGNPVPFRPDVARELLLYMPATDFAGLLRAAGMPQLALRFELGDSFARISAAGMSVVELGQSIARLRDAGVTAADALRAVARLLPIDEIERTPRELYLHRMRRHAEARARRGRKRRRA